MSLDSNFKFLNQVVELSIQERSKQIKTIENNNHYLKNQTLANVVVDVILTETFAVNLLKRNKKELIPSRIRIGKLITDVRAGGLKNVKRTKAADIMHYEWTLYKQKLHQNEAVYDRIFRLSVDSEKIREVTGTYAHQVFSYYINLENITNNTNWMLAETYNRPMNNHHPTFLCEIRDTLIYRLAEYQYTNEIAIVPSSYVYDDFSKSDPKDVMTFLQTELNSIETQMSSKSTNIEAEEKKLEEFLNKLQKIRKNKVAKIKSIIKTLEESFEPNFDENVTRYKQGMTTDMILFIKEVCDSTSDTRLKQLTDNFIQFKKEIQLYESQHLTDQGKTEFWESTENEQLRTFHINSTLLLKKVASVALWDQTLDHDNPQNTMITSIETLKNYSTENKDRLDYQLTAADKKADENIPTQRPRVLKLRRENGIVRANLKRIKMSDLAVLKKQFLVDLHERIKVYRNMQSKNISKTDFLNLFMNSYSTKIKGMIEDEPRFIENGYQYLTELNNIKGRLNLSLVKWSKEQTYLEEMNEYITFMDDGSNIDLEIDGLISKISHGTTVTVLNFKSDVDQYWEIHPELWELFRQRCIKIIEELIPTGIPLFNEFKQWEQIILENVHSRSNTKRRIDKVIKIIIHLYAMQLNKNQADASVPPLQSINPDNNSNSSMNSSHH